MGEFWEKVIQGFFTALFNKIIFGDWELERKVERVKAMAEEAAQTPQVRRIASEIAGALSETSYEKLVMALGEWVKENVAYVRERKGVDFFQPASYTLLRGAGDCEDMTILIGGMAKALGFPVKFRVSSPDGVNWRHIYPLVGVPPGRPRKWIVLDATLPAPIGTEERIYPYKKDFEA